jgi:phospholipid/cholesterol/gamma-HCH transport system substrate-binding protein
MNRLSARLLVNLGVLFVVSMALVVYGLVDLLSNPFVQPMVLYTHVTDAAGLPAGAPVTEDGLQVGEVASVRLSPSGPVVAMKMDSGRRIPSGVVAEVARANPLGEQEINLVVDGRRSGGTTRYLTSGQFIPVGRPAVPPGIGQVITHVDQLLAAISPGELNTVLGQLALAMAGRTQQIRSSLADLASLSATLSADSRQITSLLQSAPTVVDNLVSVAPAIHQDLVETDQLLSQLARERQGIYGALTNGARASALVGQLVANQLPDLACLSQQGAAILSNLAEPTNRANLVATLRDNQVFFASLDRVMPFGSDIALGPGEKPSSQQAFVRIHLLLPPATPTALAYKVPRSTPPTKPGGACESSFGRGTGPARQSNPAAPAPGGRVLYPVESDFIRRIGPGQSLLGLAFLMAAVGISRRRFR